MTEMALHEKYRKTATFGVRLNSVEQAIIKHAAKLRRTSPARFIREQAVVAAEGIVHEQTRFVLTDDQWCELESALTDPPRILGRLKQKLSVPDAWDR